jgi:hypothetical protein
MSLFYFYLSFLANHKRLKQYKQELLTRISSESHDSSFMSSDASTLSNSSSSRLDDPNANNPVSFEDFLGKLHHLLIHNQILGDHKVRISCQLMELLTSKSRELGLDSKSLGNQNFIFTCFRYIILFYRLIHLLYF